MHASACCMLDHAHQVLACLTHAAGMSTLGVQVYMETDVGACDILPPGDCSKYRASALLALSASSLTAIAVPLFCLWARQATPRANWLSHGGHTSRGRAEACGIDINS